jgi:hypothetical protein
VKARGNDADKSRVPALPDFSRIHTHNTSYSFVQPQQQRHNLSPLRRSFQVLSIAFLSVVLSTPVNAASFEDRLGRVEANVATLQATMYTKQDAAIAEKERKEEAAMAEKERKLEMAEEKAERKMDMAKMTFENRLFSFLTLGVTAIIPAITLSRSIEKDKREREQKELEDKKTLSQDIRKFFKYLIT